MADSPEEAGQMLKETITSGAALKKFAEFVKAQGGDESYILNDEKFTLGSIVEPVYAPKDGYLASCRTSEVGMTSLILGGGRETKESEIDLSVGIRIVKHLGDRVSATEPFAYLYGNNPDKVAEAKKRLLGAYTISDSMIDKTPIVKDIIQ